NFRSCPVTAAAGCRSPARPGAAPASVDPGGGLLPLGRLGQRLEPLAKRLGRQQAISTLPSDSFAIHKLAQPSALLGARLDDVALAESPDKIIYALGGKIAIPTLPFDSITIPR